GCTNKGIAISNGCHDATVTNCFIAGCTRSMFLKYEGTTRITLDHSIIMKFWIRGPLVSDVPMFDIRNNIIQDWVLFGTGIEGKRTDNALGNSSPNPPGHKSPGKPTNGLILRKHQGNVYVRDNVFKGGVNGQTKGTTNKPLSAPPIVPAYTTD